MASQSDGSAVPPRLAVLFPGQGIQRPRMGEPWLATESWQLVEWISQASGHDVADLLLTADEQALARTDRAQISVFAAALLAWSEFCRTQPKARVVALAGHSLGEYTALVAAGILTVADGAWLVGERGRAMAEAAARRPGAMAAVTGGTTAEVSEHVAALRADGADLWTANHNSPQQTVVAGSIGAVAALVDRLTGTDFGCRVLPVNAACHSPYMEPAGAVLRDALALTHFAAGTLPVVANVDACCHGGGSVWRDLSARQLTSPVRWADSLTCLHHNLRATALLDIGPGRVLAGLSRRTLPGVPSQRFAVPEPMAELAA